MKTSMMSLLHDFQGFWLLSCNHVVIENDYKVKHMTMNIEHGLKSDHEVTQNVTTDTLFRGSCFQFRGSSLPS